MSTSQAAAKTRPELLGAIPSAINNARNPAKLFGFIIRFIAQNTALPNDVKARELQTIAAEWQPLPTESNDR